LASCHEMKKGEVYVCKDCGMEIQVVRECDHSGESSEDCRCHEDGSICALTCCGKDLVRK